MSEKSTKEKQLAFFMDKYAVNASHMDDQGYAINLAEELNQGRTCLSLLSDNPIDMKRILELLDQFTNVCESEEIIQLINIGDNLKLKQYLRDRFY